MDRRQFLKTGALLTGTAALGSLAFFSLIEGVNSDDISTKQAIHQLSKIDLSVVSHTGVWDPAQIFTHCAQTIEFSMSAYPQQKSDFFKNNIGKLAFSAFESKGRMFHNLSEPIPGAESLKKEEDVVIALNRLIKALDDFDKFTGNLSPHFAYGHLSKRQYEVAHVMHLNNHLTELNFS